MNTKTILKVILIAGVGALASCAPQPETARMPVSATSRPDSSLSGRVFQAVNTYRRDHGAASLQRDPGLDRLAQEHCEYLRSHQGGSGIKISHAGFNGRARIARERYQFQSVAENVAAANYPGKNPVPVLVGVWAASRDHESNMRKKWTHTGVGVVVDRNGTVYSTQLFGTMGNFEMTPRDRFNSY